MSRKPDSELLRLRQENEKLKEALHQSQRLRHLYDESLMKLKTADRQIRDDEKREAAILDTAMDCIVNMDTEGLIIEFNAAAEKVFAYAKADVLGRPLAEMIIPPVLRDAHHQGLAQCLSGKPGKWLGRRIETTGMRADGSEFPVELSITQVKNNGSVFFTGFIRDISEQKHAEHLQQTVLMLSNLALKESLDTLMSRILDEAEALTNSQIGFFHFVEEDQINLQLQTWSTNTLENMCAAEGKGQHYPIDKAGVWVDCVRERKPVVHNDYASLPHKKGLPDGHAPVSRELVMPVIRSGSVRAIVGVGNKPSDYDESDVQTLSRLVNSVWDIVDFRRTYEQFRVSKEFNESIMEHAPVRVFWKDRDSRYLGCNAQFAKDAGHTSPDEMIGKTDFEMAWKDQAELYRADDAAVMDSGIPKIGYEETQTTPDGKTIWLRTSKVPLKDDSGEVFGILGIYDDITDQKQADVALELSESRLKEAQQVAKLGSWELDLVKNELWWSDENYRVFGVPVGTGNTYETFLKTVHPDDREYIDREYTGSVKNRTRYSIDHRILMQDGSVKWVHEQCETYYAEDGTPLRSVGTTLDMTERKKAEEDLRLRIAEAEKARQAMLYMLEDMNDSSKELEESAHKLEVSHNQLEKTLEGSIHAISRAVEARDPYTAGHQRRVADLATAIAQKMGLDENFVQGIHMGSMIHDIGKIHLPSEILAKPSKLTDMEYMLIQGHPQVGYDILKDIDFMWPVADIAHQHHERMDGSGYPQGLKGADICIEARIVAVADVVEAMASHRPYRPGLGLTIALQEIRKNRGTIYDQVAVDACLQLFKEKLFEFAYDGMAHLDETLQ